MAGEPRHRVVLVGCFLISTGANAFFIAPSSIGPLLIGEYEITTAALGTTISAVWVGGIASQLPAGVLMDRYDNRTLLVGGTVGFGLVTVAILATATFRMFLLLRVFGGLFGSFLFVVGANVVAEVFPKGKEGIATGIYLASPPASFVFAHVTSPVVGTAVGPRPVFLTEAAVVVLGLGVFLAETAGPIQSAETISLTEMGQAMRNRAVLLVAISAFTAYALYVFLNAWIPTYAQEVLSLPLTTSGVVTALIPLVGIISRPGGTWLSNRMDDRRRPVLVGGLFVGMVLVVAIPLTDYLLAFLLVVVAAALALQLGTGVYYVFTRELATPGTEGTSLTVLTTMSLTGSLVSPMVGGWLITSFSWTVAFTAIAILGLVGLVALVPVQQSQVQV